MSLEKLFHTFLNWCDCNLHLYIPISEYFRIIFWILERVTPFQWKFENCMYFKVFLKISFKNKSYKTRVRFYFVIFTSNAFTIMKPNLKGCKTKKTNIVFSFASEDRNITLCNCDVDLINCRGTHAKHTCVCKLTCTGKCTR